jgi:hypothetical protein
MFDKFECYESDGLKSSYSGRLLAAIVFSSLGCIFCYKAFALSAVPGLRFQSGRVEDP